MCHFWFCIGFIYWSHDSGSCLIAQLFCAKKLNRNFSWWIFFSQLVSTMFFLVNSLNCLFFLRSQIQAKSENVLVYLIFKWNMYDINNNKAIKWFQRAIVRAFVDNIDCVCSLDYLSKTAIKKRYNKQLRTNVEALKTHSHIDQFIGDNYRWLIIIDVGMVVVIVRFFCRCVSLVFGAF